MLEKKLIKILTIITGIFFLLLTLNEILHIFSSITNTLFGLNLESKSDFTFAIIYFILGYIILNLGIYGQKIFKKVSLLLISISLFFISFSLLIYSVNSNSENITNSIQPSIDLTLASLAPQLISEQFPIQNNSQITLSIAQNSSIVTFHNSNLTPNQANLIMQSLNLNHLNQNKKNSLSKVLISIANEQLKQNNQINEETPIPLNQLKQQIENQNLDLTLLENIDENLIQVLFPINQNAKLNILISTNDIEQTFTIGNLNQKQVNQIWDTLNFKNISFESKKIIIDIMLSQILIETQKEIYQNIDIKSIPLNTIAHALPNEYKAIFSYDIFNNDVNIRAKQIQNIRLDCNENKIQIKEICEAISITKYSTFMTNIENFSTQANVEIPQIYLDQIEKINSESKLEKMIVEYTKFYPITLFFALIFFGLSFLSHRYHCKLNKKEKTKLESLEFILKNNLITTTISTVFLTISIILISSDKFFETAKKLLPNETNFVVDLIQTLPTFQVLIHIIYEVFKLTIIFLIISLIAYLLTKKLIQKSYEIKPKQTNTNQ